MAEKDAYLNSLKEQRAEALAEIERLKQQISELAGNQTGSVA
jgi:peptidoglycan hydrolase CwlO-like protein